MGQVTVADDVVDAQGYKLVLTRDGVQEVQGEVPVDTDLLMWGGEPGFVVAVLDPPVTAADAPDGVGMALRRAADRLYDVTPDGVEVDRPAPGEISPEWVHGPAVTDLGLLLAVDLDGAGFTTDMLHAMVGIIVEELRSADAHTYVFAAPLELDRHSPLWEPVPGSQTSLDPGAA